MDKNNLIKKMLVFSIIIFFFASNLSTSTNATTKNTYEKTCDQNSSANEEKSTITLYTFEKTGTKQNKIELTAEDAIKISDVFEELKYKIVNEPKNDETQELKIDLINLLDENGLISEENSKEDILSLLNPKWLKWINRNYQPRTSSIFEKDTGIKTLNYQYYGNSLFCSLSSGGNGRVMPLFMLPRPRGIAIWGASEGSTIAANLRTGNGFLAKGSQNGITLGFMGIGLTYAIPGATIYGFIGYAIFARVNAEEITYYPPNRPPTISEEEPTDGANKIPISTSELSFRIADPDGDFMNYTVTTNPNIGSGNEQLKKGGVYKVPVSGLKSYTEYSWNVVVSDGKETVEQLFTFTTEIIEPIIYDPSPYDEAVDISKSLSKLIFNLKDNQGDIMNYTVETVPFIGYGIGTNVNDGIYTVDIADLSNNTVYYWYVNATDGKYWTRKKFSFETQYSQTFDPFNYGWNYRKKISIDHTKVIDDLANFRVLISIIDYDLKNKAQGDGDDILFMDNVGMANKLDHEIEEFNNLTGELVTWINIPFISSGPADTFFYLYYGKNDCLNKENATATWLPDFAIVQHLKEGGVGTRYDSTIYNHDGMPFYYDGDEAASGKINGADKFDGVDDFILLNGLIDNYYGTVSFWVRTGPNTEREQCIFAQSHESEGQLINFEVRYSTFKMYVVPNSNKGSELSMGTVSTNTWYYVVWISTGDQYKGYINGAENSLIINHGNNDGDWFGNIEGASDFRIGSLNYLQYDNHIPFEGIIDEVRISNIARNEAWIATEYNNQNNPSDFYSLGLEENPP